jgi:hypothetical protein
LQTRFYLRRHIAILNLYPEGYEFIHELANGEAIAVILLSPPDLIAARGRNGRFFRRKREESDGPAPYDMHWYQTVYLARHNLPSWFLRPEHMACYRYAAEGDGLGIALIEDLPVPPEINLYHGLRYPAPWSLLAIVDGPAQYTLRSLEEAERLARRFPAILVSFLQGASDILILPEGYVRILSDASSIDTNGSLILTPNDVEWIPEYQLQQRDLRPRASYQLTDADTAKAVAYERATAGATVNEEEIESQGGLIDLDQVPNGLGEFRWVDGQNMAVVRTLGYEESCAGAHSFVIAREGGAFRGMPARNLPRTVFYPDRRYLNPAQQPEGPGHWEYLTTGRDGTSERLAWTNFGGNEAEGLADVPEPTAADIWTVRQRVESEGREDITRDIDIVWVPDAPSQSASAGGSDRQESSENSSDSEVEPSQRSDSPADPSVDPETNETHDPTNAGDNDQTSSTVPNYRTKRVNGRTVTIDRARAHAGTVEPHKTWVFGKNNKWRQYPQAASLDWNNSRAVEKLNKWRDLALFRGWERVRKDDRPDYTDEERTFLFDLVKDAGGRRPETSISHIAQQFNKKFNQERLQSGISNVIGRLVKEYAKYNGQQKPRSRRGDKSKQQAEERKKRDAQQVHESDDEQSEDCQTRDAADGDGDADYEP